MCFYGDTLFSKVEKLDVREDDMIHKVSYFELAYYERLGYKMSKCVNLTYLVYIVSVTLQLSPCQIALLIFFEDSRDTFVA